MSGILPNSPAEILRALFVLKGWGTDANLTPQQAWPVYVTTEPDKNATSSSDPDSTITIRDYDGSVIFDRDAVVQYRIVNHALQVRIRGPRHTAGYAKASDIAGKLDSGFYRSRVTIGSATYLIESFKRTTDVLTLGREKPESSRRVFTINGLITVEKL